MDRREFVKSLAAGPGLSPWLVGRFVAATESTPSLEPLVASESDIVHFLLGPTDLAPGVEACLGAIVSPGGGRLKILDLGASNSWHGGGPRPPSGTVHIRVAREGGAAILHVSVDILSRFWYVFAQGCRPVLGPGERAMVTAKADVATTFCAYAIGSTGA